MGGDVTARRNVRGRKALRCAVSLLCAALATEASYAQAAAEPSFSGIALIIGNGHQEAPYAHRDAAAFERFVLDVRGFNPDRVVRLRDVAAAEIAKALQNGPRPGRSGRARVFLGTFTEPDQWTGSRGSPARRHRRRRRPHRARLPRNVHHRHGRRRVAGAEDPWRSRKQRHRPRCSLTERNRPDGRDGATRIVHPAPSRRPARLGRRQRRRPGNGGGGKGVPGRHHDRVRPPRARHESERSPRRFRGRGPLDRARGCKCCSTVRSAVPRDEPPAASEVPDATAGSVEARLLLNREERRLIQRGLAAAQLAVGPLDGIFGRRTRAAIARWQASRGVPPSGYLNADEAATLLAAGEAAASPEPSAPERPPPGGT